MKRRRKAPADKPAAAAEPAANTDPTAPADAASLDAGHTVTQPTSEPTRVKAGRSELIDTDRTLRQDTASMSRSTRRGGGAAPAATGSRYRVLSLHARGGLGAVYVAEDTELRRRVALKEIELRHANDGRSRQRFVLEAEITGRLAHPGIVPVHGLGQHEDGRPFYAMRFVEGETLLDAIQRYHRGEPADRGQRRLALRQLLKHFVDLCNAVAYAHNQGVIHRDLKPANVLLGKFGETLLVDWGLAKYLGVCQSEATALSSELPTADAATQVSADWTLPTDSGTIIGAAVGTPAYMSPEQAAGRWNDVGIPSDIYSMGATLYTVLAGAPPLPKPSESSDWLTVPLGGIAAPRVRTPETPPALAAICRKAMSPQATDRYASALDLATDVEHWLGDEPVGTMPESVFARAGRWARRHLALVSGVSAAALVLGLSLAIGLGLLANANRQITHANDQLRDANSQLVNANDRIRSANRQTIKAVDDFFTDVSDNPRLLRKEPGTQELRKALLERARNYYEGFLRERGEDTSLQAETAAAYFRLAVIQELLEPGPKALDSHRQSEAIRAALAAAAPGDATRSFDLAVSRNHIGKLLQNMLQSPDALESFRAARDALERLTAAQPNEPKYAKELARVLDNIGVTSHLTGHSREALDAVGRARTILEQLVRDHPADAEIGKEFSTTLGILGALQRLGGQPAEAVVTLTTACGILERLARDHPNRPEFAQDLAESTNLLAIALTESKREDDALAAYARAREIREKLVRENPGVAEYIQELAVTYNNIATVLRVHGRPKDAIESCCKARDLQKKLVADHPDLLEYAQDLARTHNNLGILNSDQLERDAAVGEYLEAKRIQERLTKAQPQNVELAQELAKCCHSLGRLYFHLARLDESRAPLEQARSIRETLVAAPSAAPIYRVELVESHLDLADLSCEQGRILDALHEAGRALEVADKLPAELANPSRSSAWRAKALAMSRAKRYAESLAAWDEALKVADAANKPLLLLGRATTQMRAGDAAGIDVAQTVISEPNSPPAILLEAARVFAIGSEPAHHALALELVKRAATAGWFRDPLRMTALKADADFAAVRQQPAFGEWEKTFSPKRD